MSEDSEEAPEGEVDDTGPPEADAEPTDDETDGGDADEEATEVEADDAGDAIEDDDFVRVAYTARTAETEQLVDTTDPEVAEADGVDTEERTFEPRVIAIGAGHLFPSVENELIGKEVGETGSVEVPASEAFGEYDPEDVRTVSVDTLPEDDRRPGSQVEIDGEHGFVQSVVGGRARVDFNHPLAGEAIEYEYEVLDRIDDRLEQARAFLGTVVDADLELWIETDEEERPVEDADEETEDDTEVVEVETLYVESVPQLALNQQWMFRKRQIAQEIIDRVGIDRVIVQETIEGMGGGPGGMQAALNDIDVEADDIADEIEDAVEEEEAVESPSDG